jgi:hypothetical protein
LGANSVQFLDLVRLGKELGNPRCGHYFRTLLYLKKPGVCALRVYTLASGNELLITSVNTMTFSRTKEGSSESRLQICTRSCCRRLRRQGMCLFLRARIELLDWACFPANRKDQPMNLRESDADVLNVARLDEACLPGGHGNKAHWFVKRGALVYLYYSQDITDLFLFNTLHHRAHAMQATPPRHISTHYVLLAILQMTSPAVCHRCG